MAAGCRRSRISTSGEPTVASQLPGEPEAHAGLRSEAHAVFAGAVGALFVLDARGTLGKPLGAQPDVAPQSLGTQPNRASA